MRNLKSNPAPLGRLFFLIILFCLVPVFDNALPADNTTINSGRKKGYVTISDPGCLGSVLISSEHETISVDEMIKEFEIELLDDYFARSLAYRHKTTNMEK